MSLTKVYDAPSVFRVLNGIINVYKPAGMKWKHVKTAILHNICKDLNELQVREPGKCKRGQSPPLLEPGGAANPLLRKLEEIDYSDHILATGPRYQIHDIRMAPVANLGQHTSGVLLFGINAGLRQSSKIQLNRPVRVYHVTGRLGIATESHLAGSLVTVRSNYHHVHSERIGAVAASMQASHQRKMYELCGVDMQSQTAYELACKGLIRPANNTMPVIYGIKLIDYQRPHFTLEIHAINETEAYLATLVHEMGIELRTVAFCSAIRCIRHAKFDLENSLLRHHWNLSSVLWNIRKQREILKAHPYLLNQERIELHETQEQQQQQQQQQQDPSLKIKSI